MLDDLSAQLNGIAKRFHGHGQIDEIQGGRALQIRAPHAALFALEDSRWGQEMAQVYGVQAMPRELLEPYAREFGGDQIRPSAERPGERSGGQPASNSRANAGPVRAVAISPDGKWLVSCVVDTL